MRPLSRSLTHTLTHSPSHIMSPETGYDFTWQKRKRGMYSLGDEICPTTIHLDQVMSPPDQTEREALMRWRTREDLPTQSLQGAIL